MKITVSAAKPLALSVDVLAICVPKGARRTGLLKKIIDQIGPSAGKAMRRADFKGKKGQLCEIATGKSRIKADAVMLVGLGDATKLTHACLRRLAAKAARRASSSRCTSMGFLIPNARADEERIIAEGVTLGGYRFDRYKTGDNKPKYVLDKVTILTDKKVNADLRGQANAGQRLADAVTIARDLINTAPNDLYPESLANFCKELAKKHKDDGLTCTVFSHKQIKDKGMNLIDAVGRGSARGPRLIHLKYAPKGAKDLKKLVFVGKGITFDTGGICLKPAPGMDEMKGDMGGAANMIALMAAVAETKPNAEIHGIVASAENMPDGDAYRPGDIFTGYNGTTVEIINTDAEGRLVLADALAYATELEPDLIVDNATLTGACVVALGPTVSAYYSNQDSLAEQIGKAAKTAGEAMWHMPLVDDLRDKLKSEWADCKHMGDRWGGSITAALFLERFVNDLPWIHLDVAGPSMADKSYDIYTKGGTGAGVLTYLALIDDLTAPPPAPAGADAQ